MAKSPAWQRKAGKNPKGGLNAVGRASAKAEGMNLQAPVKSGDNPRRASFLARMGGMPGPERKPGGEPTRLLLSLQAWGASSKADAKAKAAAISKRNKSKGTLDSYIPRYERAEATGSDIGKVKTVEPVKAVVKPVTSFKTSKGNVGRK